jgi:hypothetical protein
MASSSSVAPTKLFGYDFVSVPGIPSMTPVGMTDPSVMFGDLYAAYTIADNSTMTV